MTEPPREGLLVKEAEVSASWRWNRLRGYLVSILLFQGISGVVLWVAFDNAQLALLALAWPVLLTADLGMPEALPWFVISANLAVWLPVSLVCKDEQYGRWARRSLTAYWWACVLSLCHSFVLAF